MQTEQEKTVSYATANHVADDFEKLLSKDHKIDVVYDDNAWARTMRLAELMAASGQAVPKHCRDNKGMCFSLILQCHAWGISNYFAAAWETYVEPKADRLCYMAKLVMAAAKLSGVIQGGFEFEYQGEGPNLQCRAGAMVAGKMSWGEWRTISSVSVKNSPLWSADPKQQFAYSRALSWIRLKHPEIIMGVYTPDELEGITENTQPISDVDLSTPLEEVESIIAELAKTTTPAEQKLIRPKIEAVTGAHRSKALAAYSDRTKFFKEQAKQAAEAEKQPAQAEQSHVIQAWINALNEADNLEILDEIWGKVPDELGEVAELVDAYTESYARLGGE